MGPVGRVSHKVADRSVGIENDEVGFQKPNEYQRRLCRLTATLFRLEARLYSTFIF